MGMYPLTKKLNVHVCVYIKTLSLKISLNLKSKDISYLAATVNLYTIPNNNHYRVGNINSTQFFYINNNY